MFELFEFLHAPVIFLQLHEELPFAVTGAKLFVVRNKPPALVVVPPRFSMSNTRWPNGLNSVKVRSERRG